MRLSPHEIAFLVIPRWPEAHHKRAVAVFLAESKGETDAIGRSDEGENLGQRDHGYTQVSGRWHGAKLQATPDWRNPEVSTDLAKAVWDETKAQGEDPWSAWSVYNSGSYKTFLPDAEFGLAAPFPPPRPLATVADVADLMLAIEAARAEIGNLRQLVETVSGELASVREHFT